VKYVDIPLSYTILGFSIAGWIGYGVLNFALGNRAAVSRSITVIASLIIFTAALLSGLDVASLTASKYGISISNPESIFNKVSKKAENLVTEAQAWITGMAQLRAILAATPVTAPISDVVGDATFAPHWMTMLSISILVTIQVFFAFMAFAYPIFLAFASLVLGYAIRMVAGMFLALVVVLPPGASIVYNFIGDLNFESVTILTPDRWFDIVGVFWRNSLKLYEAVLKAILSLYICLSVTSAVSFMLGSVAPGIRV